MYNKDTDTDFVTRVYFKMYFHTIRVKGINAFSSG